MYLKIHKRLYLDQVRKSYWSTALPPRDSLVAYWSAAPVVSRGVEQRALNNEFGGTESC